MIKQFEGALPHLSKEGVAQVELGGRPFTLRQSLVDDLQGQKIEDAIHNLNAALLVLHAPRDEVVSIDHAAKIFIAAKHPKSFITLDDANHLITRAPDAEYVAEVISAWVTRYLDLTPPAPPIGAPRVSFAWRKLTLQAFFKTFRPDRFIMHRRMNRWPMVAPTKACHLMVFCPPALAPVPL